MIKWIYNLGVQHERMRIKKLIAEFHNELKDKEDAFGLYSNTKKERTQRDLEISYEASRVLSKLISPPDGVVDYQPMPAPIDKEKH